MKKETECRACLAPSDIGLETFADKDCNRVLGRIAQALAVQSPWMDILAPVSKLMEQAIDLMSAWEILKKYQTKK